MNKTVHLLWSGGLDSTIMLAKLCELGYKVMLHHLYIRFGGKDTREKEAMRALLPILKRKFGEFSFNEYRHRISPCNDRNLKMIMFIKQIVQTHTPIALGTLKTDEAGQYPTTDGDEEYLSEHSNHEIITWDSLGIHNFNDIYKEGIRLLGKKTLAKTWSCQLWFKKPCGKCFSCKRRKELLGI